MNEDLNSYALTLIEDSQMVMDEFQTPEMAFTASTLDKIEDLLDCNEIVKEHCRLTKTNGNVIGEIHAYAMSTNGEVLYLFFTYYNPSRDVKTKSNSDCQMAFNRAQGFYNAAIRGVYKDLDSNSPEYRAAKFIYGDKGQNIQSVNIVVLSNYIINNPYIKKIKIASKPVFIDVWDLRKIYSNTHSMSDHIAIDIDFESEEYSRYKIPFIQMESSEHYEYKCILAMFPAKLIYQLYERYNTNLLYSNVRYFLGLKGTKEKKPNVAMLETLRKENEMFLAYNNGITALAHGISSETIGDKTDITDPDSKSNSQYITMGILKKISDFRIINGGQTTAVIFNAKNISKNTTDPEKKVNLLGVYVQVKLIISENIEKISGKITRTSNFQNNIKVSDFSVSNPFNTTLEKLSRNIIAPNKNNEPTYWFFERLRGQYDEIKKKINTKADKEYFEFQFPKKRKFTKEEVAKVWTNWDLRPFDSVKGASTTYTFFMNDINKRGFVPDEVYYQKTVALLIIYKFLMSRPENKSYTNGKATVVAYAMALLSKLTSQTFDLLKTWQNQGLSDNTKIFLNKLCDIVYQKLSLGAQALNTSILSYGKTKAAFENISQQSLGVDFHLLDDDRTTTRR